jgi:hypothetical protein
MSICPATQTLISIPVVTVEAIAGSYLDEEHPAPACYVADLSQVQEAISHQGGDDGGYIHGGPEEAQAYGQLVVLVEIRQVQDDL